MLSLASSLNSQYLDAPQLEAVSVTGDASWHVALNVAASRYFERGRAFGIDGSSGCLACLFFYGNNSSFRNPNIGFPCGGARAVDDGAVADQGIESHGQIIESSADK